MNGTVAVTDPRWYRQLRDAGAPEVNFWKPSARQRFTADAFSPFFFKLPKPYFAICGFGFFAQYTRLPVWLVRDAFGRFNGCESLAELQERIQEIRVRFGYEPGDRDSEIGRAAALAAASAPLRPRVRGSGAVRYPAPDSASPGSG